MRGKNRTGVFCIWTLKIVEILDIKMSQWNIMPTKFLQEIYLELEFMILIILRRPARKLLVLYPSAYGIKNRIRWGERRLYLKVEFPSDLELRNEINLFPANIWILKFWWRKLWEKKNLKNQMLAGNNLNLFLNSRSEEILTLAEVRFSVIYFSAINQI